MKVTVLLQRLVLASLLFIATNLLAEDNPQALVENATNALIKELKTRKAEIEADKAIVNGIVERLLLPHIASNTISRRVLGIHARSATDEQKERFAEAFRGYMIRFYSNAFAEYNDETVDFLDPPDYEGAKRVTVKSKLNRSSGPPIPINYILQPGSNGWKIVDVVIEGVSLVISNKEQYKSSISRDGLDTVIAKLEYKNSAGETEG